MSFSEKGCAAIMNNLINRIRRRGYILGIYAAALLLFPALIMADDAKPYQRAFSLFCHDFSAVPQSRFAEMSGDVFSAEYERLRKELEECYSDCYAGLDEYGRKELFESEVFWEKYFGSYERNVRGVLDRPLLIYAGGADSPVITNIYREIITDILKWRIDDLKRWQKGAYRTNPGSMEAVKMKLYAERRRYAELKSDAVLLRYILYHYDRRNMDKVANTFGEKKLEFLESRTSDERTLLCERLEMRARGNRVLEMIAAGLRGIAPVARRQ